MLSSPNKKAGFLGTLFFHVLVLVICFFSSIGYTSIEIPTGIEIEFVPYQELNLNQDINEENNEKLSDPDFDNDNLVEEIIVEDDQNTIIPNSEDSVTFSEENDKNQSFSISSELENALSKINESVSTSNLEKIEENKNDLDIINTNNSPVDDVQDGYQLSQNRLAVRKVKPNYSCQEFGKVVVRVWVNREGVTIKAEPGIRGTTESAPCLLKEAKSAALQTTWTPYFNAPEIQIGQITYNFYNY